MTYAAQELAKSYEYKKASGAGKGSSSSRSTESNAQLATIGQVLEEARMAIYHEQIVLLKSSHTLSSWGREDHSAGRR
jgi:hypothetical protein